MSKYKDFDKLFEEKRDESIDFKLRGREYSLPASPPFDVILQIERMIRSKAKDEILENSSFEHMCELLFGKKNLKHMRSDGVTMEELQSVFQWLWTIYQSPGKNEDGSGNARKLTSSKTGTSSKQTSKESTQSTLQKKSKKKEKSG